MRSKTGAATAGMRVATLLVASVGLSGCAKRIAVVGPLSEPGAAASSLEGRTRLGEPARIDFRWQLNESGSRASGVGVARVEPPYRARLDLFLDNGETVIAAALVDDELRLPPGAPEDVLPPVELLWGTLGVFRPMPGASLLGGDRLEGDAERLRYGYGDGLEIHYEIGPEGVRGLEVLDGRSVVQWVRVTNGDGARFPQAVTYRNLQDFRELRLTRTAVRPAEPFDPAIWDPRQ